MTMTREQLEAFLEKDIPCLNSKKIVIWGTGNTAQLYYEGLTRLETEGFSIYAYCDSSPEKWGKTFNGKTIIRPKELAEIENVCVLICTPHSKAIDEISEQLKNMGIEHYLIDAAILKNHKKEVMQCYDLLEDEKSKDIYARIIVEHTGGGYISGLEKDGNQYFAIKEFGIIDEGEVFVDCGAYVGDSIEQYIWHRYGVFKKIIAFEPDSGNYQAMCNRVERLKREWNLRDDKIELYPYGISSKNQEAVFETYENNNGLGSKFIETDNAGKKCRLVSVDEYIKEPYSFLKADIESYEYQMLLGASESIKRWAPRLAVCIYHNAVDLYMIPLLIKSINKNYKLAVRHHSTTLSETVLYCWCD